MKETVRKKEAELVYDSKYPQIYRDIDNNVCPICKGELVKTCKKCGVEAHLKVKNREEDRKRI